MPAAPLCGPTLKLGRDVFTTGHVAKMIGVAPRTVSKCCDSGELVCYRVPTRGTGGGKTADRRITRDNLIGFLERRAIPLPPLLRTRRPVSLFCSLPPVFEAANEILCGYRVGRGEVSCVLVGTESGYLAACTSIQALAALDDTVGIALWLPPDKRPEDFLTYPYLDRVFPADADPETILAWGASRG